MIRFALSQFLASARFTSLALILAICGFQLFTPETASAQAVERIATFQQWTAWKTTENSQPICYMGARPMSDEGNYTRRGDIAFVVTHRPNENLIGEVAYSAGYTYQENSTVELNIDGTVFTLLTAGGTAWTANVETDRAVVQAMIRGSTAIVQGYSSRGTLTTDTYSLSGFTAAYQAISEACGLQ